MMHGPTNMKFLFCIHSSPTIFLILSQADFIRNFTLYAFITILVFFFHLCHFYHVISLVHVFD